MSREDSFTIVVAINKGDDRAEALKLMHRGLSISGGDQAAMLTRAHTFVSLTKLVTGGKFSSYGLVAVQNEQTGEVVKTWPI